MNSRKLPRKIQPARQRASLELQQTALMAETVSLREQLTVAKEQILARDAEVRRVEDQLTARIHDLNDQVKVQRELLNVREAEVGLLRSQFDSLLQQVARCREERDRAAAEADRLGVELRDAKLELAKLDMKEWRMIRRWNSLRRRLRWLFAIFAGAGVSPKGGTANRHRSP